MSKDLGCRWNFLVRQKGEMKQGREDSSFSYFKDNEIHCLVREYIQNSMDFPETDDSVVRVEFSFGELRCDDYPNLIQSLIPRLAACSEACQKFQGGKDPYHTSHLFLKGREHGTLGFLKVSDYNTEGMYYVDDEDVGSPFDSCLHNASGSFKKNRRSGGSHGQGKTVGFVNSPINAVYYSTMTFDTHETFGEGVIRLCNHRMLDETGAPQHYQADAFYNKGGSPNTGDEIPEIFRRYEPGTDAFVLGMEHSEEVERQMKVALLRSFFPAIAHNHLVAVICGEKFDAGNLNDKMRQYFPEPRYGEFDLEKSNQPQLVFNPRPYCFEIAMVDTPDDNHIVFTTDDFPGQFPYLEKASLSVWKDERIKAAKSRDTILFMRDKEMIIEVQRYNSSKGYYGIFSCEGEGNVALRDLENVTHDKWSESELKGFDPEDVTRAKKTKKEVKDFVSACFALLFPEERDEEKEILALRRRRLGAFGNRNNNNVDEDSIITLSQTTPSNGYHLIYKTDDDLKNVSNGSNIFKDYSGIDCRSDGYIVVEPSVINGRRYTFENKYDIKEMPQQLKQFILENANLKNSANKQPYKKPTYVDVGDRDNQLFSYINSIYYKTRLDYDEILCLANHFNETVFEKPLPERDVRYKVKKVFDKDRSTMIFINLDE